MRLQARLEVGGPAVPIGSKRLGFALPAKYSGGAAPAPTDGSASAHPTLAPTRTLNRQRNHNPTASLTPKPNRDLDGKPTPNPSRKPSLPSAKQARCASAPSARSGWP